MLVVYAAQSANRNCNMDDMAAPVLSSHYPRMLIRAHTPPRPWCGVTAGHVLISAKSCLEHAHQNVATLTDTLLEKASLCEIPDQRG